MNNIPTDLKIYPNAKIFESTFSCRDIVGENSIIDNCSFGSRVSIGRFNNISHSHIGDGSYTNDFTVIKYAKIGKYCSISWNVTIGGANHDFERITSCPLCRLFDDEKAYYKSFFEEELVIGNDVWVAAGVHILRGVHIGDGAIIGANSVVTKDVPPYEIWGGNPARFIKKRFSDKIIEQLIKIKWWNFSQKQLTKAKLLFKQRVDEEIIEELKKISREE